HLHTLRFDPTNRSLRKHGAVSSSQYKRRHFSTANSVIFDGQLRPQWVALGDVRLRRRITLISGRACTHKIADPDSDLIVRFDALCGLKSGTSRGPTGHKPSSSTSPSMLSKRHNEVKSIISFDFNRESFAAINARISSAI